MQSIATATASRKRKPLSMPGRLRRLRPSAFDAAAEGALVKLVGVVRQLDDVDLLRAPLSGRSCCCWDLSVVQGHTSSEILFGTYTLRDTPRARHREGRRFSLECAPSDGSSSGEVVVVAVDPLMMNLTDATRVHAKTGVMAPLPDGIRELLDAGVLAPDFVARQRRATFFERILCPGDRVAVVGRCRLRPDPAGMTGAPPADYRQPPQRLELHPCDGITPLWISDRPSAMRRRGTFLPW